MHTRLIENSILWSMEKNENKRYHIWNPIRLTIMTTHFAFYINYMHRPVGSGVVRLLADDIVLFS